jgi:chromosome segregation protein
LIPFWGEFQEKYPIMKFSKLRLTGFKSFVEPTELVIEHGLTGVVGPNGCGKSNLLEALRWVMGENSYKSMRGSGMEDVIFSGTTQRPARNLAEVMLTLGNDDRTAPPAYNDSEVLEVSRAIERDEGSTYRVNGKEVRARDVQLFFADVSTGSRSPALVKQGQIAEIINSKPQARRLILEEAAGITGLHTRRHDAELKLKAAEQNLARLDDVTSQLESQLNSLRRQARQATKYKQVSADIRKLEAAGLFVAWRDASETARRDAAALDEATRILADHTRLSSEKLRSRDALGETLPGLREQEAIRAAVLQRLSIERSSLDEEEKRVEVRLLELKQRRSQFTHDQNREEGLLADTDGVIARLTEEAQGLEAASGADSDLRNEAATALQVASDALARAQDAADEASRKLSDLAAQRTSIERTIAEQRNRLQRLEQEAVSIVSRRQSVMSMMGDAGDGVTLGGAVEAALVLATSSEQAASHSEVSIRVARQVEADKRQAYDEARRVADRLQTEVSTLTKFLTSDDGGLWPALVDAMSVAPGYEAALAAALGDDIEASSDEGAPVHWRGLPDLGSIAALPGDAQSLSQFVQAPAALARILNHVGVVSRATGMALQAQLQPGQRLVSREGDVWRWDGFVATADAPSAAAKRLAERNRLASLEAEMSGALVQANVLKAEFDDARTSVEQGVKSERDKRDAWRTATAALDVARRALQAHERKVAEHSAQASALEEASRLTEAQLRELQTTLQASQSEFSALPELDSLHVEASALRESLNAERATTAEARARHDGLEREARMRGERLKAITTESEQWRNRAAKAREQIASLTSRTAEIEASIDEMNALPQQLADKRFKLMNLLSEAERDRKSSADSLQSAENNVRIADQALRDAQEQAATSRETHARLGAHLESSKQRHEHCSQRISETLQCAPEEVLQQAGVDADRLPGSDEIERKLVSLRDDRERLGAVNLRADEEAQAVDEQLTRMKSEKDELVQAIAKLRGGISTLNKEGRQRLLDAFGTVNAKFTELFKTLFGGGEAELQLIESDDPLEAGLEIMAKPPGKKPTTLSLLSGGEQTLTAMALIFAVFLTNPSPICVLDEVDAPLDDHNVERFCNLLDAMLNKTETRFLIITHHPLTMARMHRLFGVTMMERGVSQLVSVNLQEAEQMVDAA